MPSPVAFFDPDLDPALFERRTLAAGMTLEKHFRRRGDPPRPPEYSYQSILQGLTQTLEEPRLSPPVRAVVLHEPEGSRPDRTEEARTVRALISSAAELLWVEQCSTRFPVPPPWPEAERLPTEESGLVVYRLSRGFDATALLRRLGGADRDQMYLLADPRPGARLKPEFNSPHGFDHLLAYVKVARWVLTSHNAWPDWVPFCLYTLSDPRELPGLNSPDIRWMTTLEPGVAPVLPGQDSPSFESVADTTALAHAELIDLMGTRVVGISALAAYPAMRGLSLKDCPFVHRWELAHLPHLELLDLSGVPMRDLEPLRALRKLHTLRLDLRPRVGWEALRALPWLRHLELYGILELDVEELAANLSVPALTLYPRGDRRDWNVAALSRVAGLQALAVETPEANLEGLSALPHLQALSVWGKLHPMPRGLERLTALEVSNLSSVRALPEMPALRRLKVSLEDLAGLDRLPPLEYLELKPRSDSSLSLGPLVSQPDLRSLVLSDFDELPPEVLLRFSRLEELGISGTLLDVSLVGRLPHLRRLELIQWEPDLAPLASHPTLEEIGIGAMDEIRHPEALLQLPALRRVVYWSAPLPPEIVSELRARGVVVHTHPLGRGFSLHHELW